VARIVFLGTTDYSVPILEALLVEHEVIAVITQPDRPAGRGRRLTMPPVKTRALAADIPVFQPARLSRDQETLAQLCDLAPDLFVLAAYGQILKPNVLAIPPHGTIGVHASLLPRWRGAAPVAAAILNGDPETGVTLMLTDEGMDTGPIIAQRSIPIGEKDTRESLTRKLSFLGADLLRETLPDWLAGRIRPVPQNDALATYAPPLAKDAGRLDWSLPAVQLARIVRACTPWPGAFLNWRGQRIRVIRAHPESCPGESLPGTVISRGKTIGVATVDGILVLEQLQPPGKRPMTAIAFVSGRPGFVGSRLTVGQP